MIPPYAPGTFQLTTLRKGVWVFNNGLYLTLLLKHRSRLVIFDMPDRTPSADPDTRLINATDQILGGTNLRRVNMIYAHAHFDDIGGVRAIFNNV